jgi:hypothetical protein
MTTKTEQLTDAKTEKLALTPEFEKIFGRKPTNFENADKMHLMIIDHEMTTKRLNAPDLRQEQSGSSPDHADNEVQRSIESLKVEVEDHSGPCVVIPYKKTAAKGLELLYALRAWAKNLPNCKIVIIGDQEDYFSDEIIVIPAALESENPQIDVALKMLQAIASDDVPSTFIWSNDDIYPVTPIHVADLLLLTCSGKLGETKPTINGMYQENYKRTLNFLKENGLPFNDYSTHTPYVFDKFDLANVISEAQADEEGFLISSLYFNKVHPDIVPVKITGGPKGAYVVYVYRDNPDMNVVTEAFKTRKFVNHNNKGYAPVLPLLKKHFPDKSRFER